jgi:hypothetical protein
VCISQPLPGSPGTTPGPVRPPAIKRSATRRPVCFPEVEIARAGRPVARLTAIEPKPQGRRFGAMKGRAVVDDRFFEPLPEQELAAWEQS